MSTLSDLRKIIREEVRNAMQEELREILVEAVQIASTPETDNSLHEVLDLEEAIEVPAERMPSREDVRRMIRGSVTSPITELLEETQANMSRQDLSDMYGGGSAVSAPEMEAEGAAEELPSFVSRAAAVFKASQNIKPGGAVGGL